MLVDRALILIALCLSSAAFGAMLAPPRLLLVRWLATGTLHGPPAALALEGALAGSALLAWVGVYAR